MRRRIRVRATRARGPAEDKAVMAMARASNDLALAAGMFRNLGRGTPTTGKYVSKLRKIKKEIDALIKEATSLFGT